MRLLDTILAKFKRATPAESRDAIASILPDLQRQLAEAEDGLAAINTEISAVNASALLLGEDVKTPAKLAREREEANDRTEAIRGAIIALQAQLKRESEAANAAHIVGLRAEAKALNEKRMHLWATAVALHVRAAELFSLANGLETSRAWTNRGIRNDEIIQSHALIRDVPERPRLIEIEQELIAMGVSDLLAGAWVSADNPGLPNLLRSTDPIGAEILAKLIKLRETITGEFK